MSGGHAAAERLPYQAAGHDASPQSSRAPAGATPAHELDPIVAW